MPARYPLPIYALLVASAFYLSAEAFAASRGDHLSVRATELYFLLVGFLLSWWVARDRECKSFSVSIDFHFYVLFFWLLVVPYYLLRTRGRSGVVPAILLVILAFCPTLIAVASAAVAL
jgi:hypothetical protein